MMFELAKDSRWEGFFGQEKFFDGRISWYFFLQRIWQNSRMRGCYKLTNSLAFSVYKSPSPTTSLISLSQNDRGFLNH